MCYSAGGFRGHVFSDVTNLENLVFGYLACGFHMRGEKKNKSQSQLIKDMWHLVNLQMNFTWGVRDMWLWKLSRFLAKLLLWMMSGPTISAGLVFLFPRIRMNFCLVPTKIKLGLEHPSVTSKMNVPRMIMACYLELYLWMSKVKCNWVHIKMEAGVKSASYVIQGIDIYMYSEKKDRLQNIRECDHACSPYEHLKWCKFWAEVRILNYTKYKIRNG